MRPEQNANPRMPLTSRGIIYLFFLVACSIVAAYIVIRAIGVLDAEVQYSITISLIVFFIAAFFTRDKVWIGIGERLLWSAVFAIFTFLIFSGIDFLFETLFGV